MSNTKTTKGSYSGDITGLLIYFGGCWAYWHQEQWGFWHTIFWPWFLGKYIVLQGWAS